MTPPGTTSWRSRYEVERTLGSGGMATVYLARDTVLGRDVAVKVLAEHLSAHDDFRARFLREARFAARVTHRNVVQVYDAGEDESGLFIVMEYVEGESLAEELRRRGRLPSAEVIELGIQLCAALDAAHSAGLVHRDVKPQNVLRAGDGTVKLSDFGIARSDDSTVLTAHGSVLGTAAYLAPEQARGAPVTAASDLYALGVVLYEALTGRRPHDGASLSELVLRREREPAGPPSALVAGVPAVLDAAILRCLALRPEERPSSAAALGAELAGAPAPDTATAATLVAATQPLPTRTRSRRRRRLVAALAILALAGAGLAVGLLSMDGSGNANRQAARSTTAPATTRQTTQAATSTPTVATTPPAVQHPAPPPSPCATLDQRRQRLDDERRALDAEKHATKDKAQKRALDRRRHALDDRKRALDKEQKACR